MLESWLRGSRASARSAVSSFILGALAGAAAMWLLDPSRGHQRRARLRQKAVAAARRVQAEARKQARGAARRAQGRQYELQHMNAISFVADQYSGSVSPMQHVIYDPDAPENEE